MFNQTGCVKLYSNGLLFTSEWHLHLADIANTYQSSTLSQMSTDVNKPLKQQSKQLLEREQTGYLPNWTEGVHSALSGLSVLTTRAVVTSQGLWWLDERASPGGANGDILNLKQQPVCQYAQRKKRWESARESDAETQRGFSCLSRQRGSWSRQHILLEIERGQGCQSQWRGDGGGITSGAGAGGGWAGVVFHSCWPVWSTANCHPV